MKSERNEKKVKKFKRVALKVFPVFCAIMIASTSMSHANQTVAIDLNSFQSDGLGTYPNYTVSGLADGDIVTVNISNSTQGFLGYINNGAGNSINISNGGAINLTNNTGQFFGVGNLSSLAYNNSIVGNYTVTVTLGSDSLLSSNIATESQVASSTSDPNSSVGLLILDWRMGGSSAGWKQISLVRSGVAPSQSSTSFSNALKVTSRPTLSQADRTMTCTSGEYVFLNGGSTEQNANLGALVYTLVIDGKPVSRIGAGKFTSLPSHFFPAIAQSVKAAADMKSASFDVSGLSNFRASCEVYAWQDGANMQTVSEAIDDSGKIAAAKAKADAEEAARQAALVEFNSKENRELRKRLAARGIRG